jgi:hypothetical protein
MIDRGSIPSRGNVEIFSSSPPRPDRLWGPANLVSDWYRGQSGLDVKLTTHLHLVPRLRLRGAVPSLLLCDFVKHRDNFTFTLLPKCWASSFQLSSHCDPRAVSQMLLRIEKLVAKSICLQCETVCPCNVLIILTT